MSDNQKEYIFLNSKYVQSFHFLHVLLEIYNNSKDSAVYSIVILKSWEETRKITLRSLIEKNPTFLFIKFLKKHSTVNTSIKNLVLVLQQHKRKFLFSWLLCIRFRDMTYVSQFPLNPLIQDFTSSDNRALNITIISSARARIVCYMQSSHTPACVLKNSAQMLCWACAMTPIHLRISAVQKGLGISVVVHPLGSIKSRHTESWGK